MNRKISVSMAVTIAIIAMTVTFSVTMVLAMRLFDDTVSSVNEKESQYTKLSELDRYVRDNEFYAVNNDTLNDMLASGYVLGTGDKYARYYTAKGYADLLAMQSGKTMGIGVMAVNDPPSGYARITQVYADTPASELGMVKNGYITRINDVDVKTYTTNDAIAAALRGEAGTTVSVTYLSPDMTESVFEITRRSYVAATVWDQTIDETIGYVNLNDINESTPADFSYSVNRQLSAGATALVVDLRGVNSTDITSAISCVDVLVGKGDVAFAKDKDGNTELLGSSDENAVSVPVVFVVNEGTGDAAELLASATKTMGTGRIVGTRTMGKAAVMGTPQRMSDGSAVTITVAQIVDANGETFEGTGVNIDNEVALNSDEFATVGATTAECDSQVRKALEVALNGTK